ncbi:hypothetical protein TSUD_366030 [Trifolium subterraneum]|uniref:DUF4283 domain-containing protein n=1 Tax=Trifolium subterraneum TaxID=3900 RepID=A0A2Z6NDQ9_TRISU|nr:hypothetical protein TSUD_366030 [Trifolium subterraneum]
MKLMIIKTTTSVRVLFQGISISKHQTMFSGYGWQQQGHYVERRRQEIAEECGRLITGWSRDRRTGGKDHSYYGHGHDQQMLDNGGNLGSDFKRFERNDTRADGRPEKEKVGLLKGPVGALKKEDFQHPTRQVERAGVQVGDIVVKLGARKEHVVRNEGQRKGDGQRSKDLDTLDVATQEKESSILLRKYQTKSDDVQWTHNGLVATIINGEAIPLVQNRITDAVFNDIVIIPMGADKDVSPYHRGAWVCLYGVPLHALNVNFFKLCVLDCEAANNAFHGKSDVELSEKQEGNMSGEGESEGEGERTVDVLSPVCDQVEVQSTSKLDPQGEATFQQSETQECLTTRRSYGESRRDAGNQMHNNRTILVLQRRVVLAFRALGVWSGYKIMIMGKRGRKAGGLLRHPFHSLKKVARLPKEDRVEVLKVLNKRALRRRKGFNRSCSESCQATSEGSSSSDSINNDRKNWVAMQGNDQMVMDDVRGIGKSLGVKFKGDNTNMFNVLSRVGKSKKERSGHQKGEYRRRRVARSVVC